MRYSNLAVVQTWRLFVFGRFVGTVDCTFAELVAALPSARLRIGGGVELWR